MKTKFITVWISVFVGFSCSGFSQTEEKKKDETLIPYQVAERTLTTGTLIDINLAPVYDLDNNKYTVVKIGKQYWFQQNLRTTQYRDKTAILTDLDASEWKQTTKGAYSYFENLSKNADSFGLLYNGYAASTGKLCPEGWHIPTDEEWKELETFLGIGKDEINRTGGRSTLAGLVKFGEYWKDNTMSMENTSGFSVVPAGTRNDYGDFMVAGQFAGIWTSTPYETTNNYLWYRHFYYNTPEFGRNYVTKNNGYSCRCLKDTVIVQKESPVFEKNVPKIAEFANKEITTSNNLKEDLGNIQMCVDVLPQANIPLPSREQVNANKFYKINPDGTVSNVAVQQQGLTAYSEKMWTPGEVIKYSIIDFNGKQESLKDTVKKYADIWENYANINFEFTEKTSEAQIRIGMESGSSWSCIGRDALQVASDAKTMNIGWLGNDADANQRVILHEFGHALGFVHEHNGPASDIKWKKNLVYQYYAQAPNFWSKDMVDQNVMFKYSQTLTNYSHYDEYSIMHYPIDPRLTMDYHGYPFNVNLSPTDKQYASIFYPFPNNTVEGTLETGDDCDEIDFRIEYDAIDRNMIEVKLAPGINRHGKLVDWWKQISLPLKGERTYRLEIEGGKSANFSIDRENLDDTKSFGFAKAKMFGIHTELVYKWNILKAIPGGTRITLTWRNDSCL
ncbi:FISUMP domain-containing protein [Aquiflexum sp.]|uniref:FISUMP domain-containing protein n=1 Tax=Aquiflexum sp. TaxID=1872584 RepID=UPI003593BF37